MRDLRMCGMRQQMQWVRLLVFYSQWFFGRDSIYSQSGFSPIGLFILLGKEDLVDFHCIVDKGLNIVRLNPFTKSKKYKCSVKNLNT